MKNQYYQVFEKFLPSESVKYCYDLWQKHGFEFKIKKGRKTKLGDYKYDPRSKKHTISINNDLNCYSFLITYLHEVAHLITFEKYKNKVAPHGTEWKQAFKMVSLPVLTPAVFPTEVIKAFSNYLINAKASSCSDPRLLKALQPYDNQPGFFLSDLVYGESFEFQDRIFQVLDKKRTRYVCLEKKSQKKYLISGSATIKKIT